MDQKGAALHVLVIEDDNDTRTNLCDILELDHHNTFAVGSAREALAYAELKTTSVIILDRRLPDSTAEALLPLLKQQAPDVAVIVVTGYADLNGAISALRLGATDYILKPIDPADLRARLLRIAAGQRTRAELKRQTEIVNSLLENVSDAIIVVDLAGNIVLYNRSAEEFIGRSRLGQGPALWAELRDSANLGTGRPNSQINHAILRALEREQVVDEEVYQHHTTLDVCRWMSVNANPMYHDGVLEGAIVVYRDITERKQAEYELRRQRDLAQGLLEAAPAIVLMIDPEGKITHFNDYAQRLTGYHADEVIGRDFFSIFLPFRDRERIGKAFQKTLEDMDNTGTVNAILTKNGKEREIRWSNRVLYDSDARIRGVLAIGQDITDLKDAQERALRTERLAAIGEMVAGLAHESRNALQRSQACLEMLALKVTDRPDALDLIARIQKAQDDLHRHYEDVRGYSAPIRIERVLCDLSQVWREAWAHLETIRKGRIANLTERFAGPDQECDADPFRMGQVFYNILENALSACTDPVEIEVFCQHITISGRLHLRIVFGDNGPGFKAADRDRLFEPFFTTKTKGTGLGLAIARRIVEAHGGSIMIGHDRPVGAELAITLPKRII